MVVKTEEYAIKVAQVSHKWYKRHAVLAGRVYTLTEVVVIAISASVPATVAIAPTNTTLIATLSAVVAAITGLRSVGHWQDDYIRYTMAREAIEAERRLYHIGAGPYRNPATRDEVLVSAVSRIEQNDMRGWARVTSRHQSRA